MTVISPGRLSVTGASEKADLSGTSFPKVLSRSTDSRFLVIDGLRGIAATSVLIFHAIHGLSERPLSPFLPAGLYPALNNGLCGVQIFFVISGFVIAHALERVSDLRGCLYFSLRRHVRLDPPYYLMIAITLLALFAESLLPRCVTDKPFSLQEIGCNLLYLQNIVHVRSIVLVGWTLCLEVQFYLVLIALIVPAIVWKRSAAAQNLPIVLTVLLIIVSVFRSRYNLEAAAPWFIDHWCFFGIGVLCKWWQSGKIKLMVLLAGCGTTILIISAFTSGNEKSWLTSRVLQYLGGISYSLYLTHFLIVHDVQKLGYKFTGESPGWAFVWLISSIALSVLAGHCMNKFVERPTIKLAAKLK